MRKKILSSFFMVSLVLLITLASVNAGHTTNDYRRYDNNNPRYHNSYKSYSYSGNSFSDRYYKDSRYYYEQISPYKKFYSYGSRYRSYYTRYHPLSYTRPRYDNYRSANINVRITNSPDAEVRVY